jgi:hypothetical protein
MNQEVRKKFGVLILFFDCSKFILKTIDNCAPFVDNIYISYSSKPWRAYNKNAPDEFQNESNPLVLKESKYYSKLIIVEGVWDSEEEQREECRQHAIKDGMDYLIVQDADEFYTMEHYKLNIEGILMNPDFNIYQCPWLTFWKNVNHVILNREHLGQKNTIYTTCPLFAINLKFDNPFVNRRLPRNMSNSLILQGICFHLSYVLTNEELYRKIKTWGHSHQVNKIWFKYKWIKWTPSTKYLNPFVSIQWVKAIPYEGELPSEIQNFNIDHSIPDKLLFFENLYISFYDKYILYQYLLRKLLIKLFK